MLVRIVYAHELILIWRLLLLFPTLCIIETPNLALLFLLVVSLLHSVVLIDDPLSFLVLVLLHGLRIVLPKVLLEFEELPLKAGVRENDGSPLSGVGKGVQHRQA